VVRTLLLRNTSHVQHWWNAREDYEEALAELAAAWYE
jgi:hypothetical protein